jgi:hypothetical protein
LSLHFIYKIRNYLSGIKFQDGLKIILTKTHNAKL